MTERKAKARATAETTAKTKAGQTTALLHPPQRRRPVGLLPNGAVVHPTKVALYLCAVAGLLPTLPR